MTEPGIETRFLGGGGLRVPALAPYWHQQKFNASRMRYTLSGAGL
jgi:hypothetical protein